MCVVYLLSSKQEVVEKAYTTLCNRCHISLEAASSTAHSLCPLCALRAAAFCLSAAVSACLDLPTPTPRCLHLPVACLRTAYLRSATYLLAACSSSLPCLPCVLHCRPCDLPVCPLLSGCSLEATFSTCMSAEVCLHTSDHCLQPVCVCLFHMFATCLVGSSLQAQFLREGKSDL
ncbi:hypothetical protein O6H91_11G033600 [Diphasiastrum complanatum]|uniref:Uncharacterized protein n=1 Tax=Diphasiastrum complanatum TaxID=34168 RepID=A0ACC2C7Y4_DIPCM|nr:hypothetical protein O6H91_11G033600 [Diphasiastrum complanatum]